MRWALSLSTRTIFRNFKPSHSPERTSLEYRLELINARVSKILQLML